MSTVASLQLKIGADVNAAINGLSKAEFASNKVYESFSKTHERIAAGGGILAKFGQNVSQAVNGIISDLNRVDTSKMTEGQAEATQKMQLLVGATQRVSESVTTASTVFTGMHAVAGAAITGIARLLPTIGVQLAALSGPIGIAAATLAAGAAIVVSNWDLVSGSVGTLEKVTIAAANSTAELKGKTLEYADTLVNAVATQKEKEESLKRLQEISPTYFGTLKTGKATVDQINTAYKAWSENLDKVAYQQAISGELTNLYTEKIKLQSKIQQDIVKYAVEETKIKVGAQNFLSAGYARATLEVDKKRLTTIDQSMKLLKDQAGKIGPIITEPKVKGKTGSAGKDVETEAQKIQKVLNELESNLEGIQAKFKAGLIPEDFSPQVDAIQSAISSIAKINPDSSAFATLVAEYKAFADQNKVFIDVVPRLDVDIQPLADLPNRAEDVAKKTQQSFVKNPWTKPIKDQLAEAEAATQAFYRKIEKNVSQAAGVFSQAFGVISSFDQASLDARSIALDEYYEKQVDIINSTISDEAFKNEKLAELEKDVAAKRKAIKRDEAAANKRNSIFSAIINTAQAVTSALASGGIPLAIIVGALGAAQTAAISAQPLPALEAGGLVRGRNTVVVGEYAGADNNPELISPVNKVKKYITEAVIESGGGGAVQLYSRIAGDDLLLVSERASVRKSRIG